MPLVIELDYIEDVLMEVVVVLSYLREDGGVEMMERTTKLMEQNIDVVVVSQAPLGLVA